MASVSLQLETWFNALPEGLLIRQRSTPMLPHVLSLHMCYWWLILDLHLPLLDSAAPSEPGTELSISMCDRATDKLIELLLAFETQHGLRFFPRNMLKVC